MPHADANQCTAVACGCWASQCLEVLPTLYKQPAQEEGNINWHILLLSLCSTGSHTVTEWWWNRTDERVQCNQLKCILSESMLLHIPNHPIIPSSSSLVRMQPM